MSGEIISLFLVK